MEMSKQDIVWYIGAIFGTSGTFVFLEMLGVEPYLLRLAISVACGVGLGWLGQSAVEEQEQAAKKKELEEKNGDGS